MLHLLKKSSSLLTTRVIYKHIRSASWIILSTEEHHVNNGCGFLLSNLQHISPWVNGSIYLVQLQVSVTNWSNKVTFTNIFYQIGSVLKLLMGGSFFHASRHWCWRYSWVAIGIDEIGLTWRCFAIDIGKTRDVEVEVGLASSIGETGEASQLGSGVAG